MQTQDLTKGSIPAHFRQLAVPAAIGMVFSTLYNVVDTYFAGLLSTDAQAGLAIAFQAFFLLMSTGIGLGAAMGALVGNAMGGHREAEARRMAAQGIGFGLMASLVLGVIGVLAGPALLSVVSEPGEYRDAGTAYFYLLLLALPGFLLAFGVNGILQALGDAVSMQRALIAAFFANIALNPLLIFGIPGVWGGIGFNGIALSTVISQSGVMAYVLWRFLRTGLGAGLTLSEIKPEAATIRAIAAQGAPVAFAMLVLIFAGFMIQFFLKSFGPAAVAAYGVALRVEQLFLLPVFGLTGALLPIAAQNFGAGHGERVRQALFDCWKFGFMFMAIACPILWLAAPYLMGVFTADAEVVRLGASYLRIDGLILPLYMMLFAINSFLQALKKPIWTLWIGVYRQALAVPLFVWLFAIVMDLGVMGVWYGIALSVTTGLILSLLVANRVATPLVGSLAPVRA